MSDIITCIIVALALFFFEIFVPGGILGVLGGISLLCAVYFSYENYGIYEAIITFLLSCTIGISFFFFEIMILSKTRFGNKFLLKQTQEGTHSNTDTSTNDLIGKTGICLTTMAPSGKILIKEQTLEGFSQSGLLKKGTPIKVVSYDSFKVIVKQIDP